MPGFSSISDLNSEISVGKYRTSEFIKTTANTGTATAGRWYEWFSATGSPGAITFSGTAGVATQLTNTTSGALSPLSEGNVSTDLRFLTSAMVGGTAATLIPAVVMLVDILLYYPSCVVTGTPTTLDNTTTLGRYTDGIGVMGICFVQTAHGAAAPALTFTYTADDASSTTGTLTAPLVSATVSTQYMTSNSPFIPTTTGIKGIKKITSYTLASGTTGTAVFALVKPLAVLPIATANAYIEKPFVQPFVGFPKIVDGACLGLIAMPGGALVTSSVLSGSIAYSWG
jgi:hypothetical protein